MLSVYSLETGRLTTSFLEWSLRGFHTLDNGTVLAETGSGRLYELSPAGLGARFLPELRLGSGQQIGGTREKLYILDYQSVVIYEKGRPRVVRLPGQLEPTLTRYDMVSLGNDRILRSNLEITGISDCEAEQAPAIPAPSSIVNAASFADAGELSMNSLFTAFVAGWGPSGGAVATVGSNGSAAEPDVRGRLVTRPVGTLRPFQDIAVWVPILYADDQQVTFLAYSFSDYPQAQIGVSWPSLVYFHPEHLRGVQTAPGIFTANGSGNGTVAALRDDGTLVTAANAATPGSVVSLFATGLGSLSPPQFGNIATGAAALEKPVTVNVGGKSAEVLYSGTSPGQTVALIQINVQVPEGVSGETRTWR